MTWPNTTISTTNLDAGTDEPRLARADLKSAVDAVNQMITDGPTRGFVEIYFYLPGVTQPGGLVRANAAINYQTGDTVASTIVANGEIVLQPGIYSWETVDHAGTGTWTFDSNTGQTLISGTTMQYSSGALIAGFTRLDYSNAMIAVNSVCSANLRYTASPGPGYPEIIRLVRRG